MQMNFFFIKFVKGAEVKKYTTGYGDEIYMYNTVVDTFWPVSHTSFIRRQQETATVTELKFVSTQELTWKTISKHS